METLILHCILLLQIQKDYNDILQVSYFTEIKNEQATTKYLLKKQRRKSSSSS